jgi:hypothetical protein
MEINASRRPHRHRTVLLLTLTLLFSVLLASSGCIDRFIHMPHTVVYPHITPVHEGQPYLYPEKEFLFQDKHLTLKIPVDGSVYRGARAAEKEVTIYGNVSESVWIPEAYLTIMNDPSQEPFYSSLIGAFRQIRSQENLDDDEYLELIATYTQSLNYEIRNRTDPKFPVETVVDGSGDCDDKSLLLAGVLSREGYRVALLLFGPESHMAVGIADGTKGYDETGYIYLETTSLSLVGIPPEHLRDSITLQSVPVVIPVGNGTKQFTKTKEIQNIWKILNETGITADQLEPAIADQERTLTSEKADLDKTAENLSALLTAGRYSDYNRQVLSYNTHASEYNRHLEVYQSSIAEYNRVANIHNYILTHLYDRKGTYEWLQNNLPV